MALTWAEKRIVLKKSLFQPVIPERIERTTSQPAITELSARKKRMLVHH